jgi:hypothetical protein
LSVTLASKVPVTLGLTHFFVFITKQKGTLIFLAPI